MYKHLFLILLSLSFSLAQWESTTSYNNGQWTPSTTSEWVASTTSEWVASTTYWEPTTTSTWDQQTTYWTPTTTSYWNGYSSYTTVSTCITYPNQVIVTITSVIPCPSTLTQIYYTTECTACEMQSSSYWDGTSYQGTTFIPISTVTITVDPTLTASAALDVISSDACKYGVEQKYGVAVAVAVAVSALLL